MHPVPYTGATSRGVARRAGPSPAELELLVHACATSRAGPGSRLIGFVAARRGEGTSSVARAFAATLRRSTGGRVLVVDAAPPEGADRLGLMEAALAGLPLERAARGTGKGYLEAPLSGIARLNGEVRRRVEERSLWAAASETFDAVVVDAPALEVSNRGVTLAEHMDAVVVVVEAETTRAPVVKRLLDLLRRVEAPVVGTVLNKRRYYVPKAIYDRL